MRVYIQDNTAREIIPEINPAFPDIPVRKRYSAEFLSHCIQVADDMEVEQGWIYEDGVFVAPPEPELPEIEEELEVEKGDNEVLEIEQ